MGGAVSSCCELSESIQPWSILLRPPAACFLELLEYDGIEPVFYGLPPPQILNDVKKRLVAFDAHVDEIQARGPLGASDVSELLRAKKSLVEGIVYHEQFDELTNRVAFPEISCAINTIMRRVSLRNRFVVTIMSGDEVLNAEFTNLNELPAFNYIKDGYNPWSAQYLAVVPLLKKCIAHEVSEYQRLKVATAQRIPESVCSFLAAFNKNQAAVSFILDHNDADTDTKGRTIDDTDTLTTLMADVQSEGYRERHGLDAADGTLHYSFFAVLRGQ